MLPGNNDNKLQRYNHVNPEFIFFVQRWNEILASKTLDVYQYNILNSCVACNELADIIEKTISGLYTSRQNVDDSKAEALAIVKSDWILEKRNRPLYTKLLHALGSKIDSKSKNDTGEERSGGFITSLNRLKFLLKSPVREINSQYMNYILLETKEALDISNKTQINKCIGVLVSQCVFQGWSSRGLAALSAVFETDSSANEKWNSFSDRVSSTAKASFKVFYSIKIEASSGNDPSAIRRTIASLGLEVKLGSDINQIYAGIESLNSKIMAEKTYIITQIESTDPYSAVLYSINLLNSSLSVATFYNTINPWIANSPEIVVLNEENQSCDSLRLTDIFKTYDYIDSNNAVFEATRQIILDRDLPEVTTKISAAFAYTNLSRSSIFQETKFITLWIALESVMRTGQYPDIITHVKTVLPEILCTRYLYRIVRNFTEDCMRCSIKRCDELSLNFEQLDKKALVRQMITVFRSQSDYPILLGKCNKNQLLEFRCEELHTLLNSREEIMNKYDHLTTKIRWHIQRLYRIRNEITHSAFSENKSLMIYIEHLYTYLAQLMSEVVHCIVYKEATSVDEAYTSILQNYLTYMALLKDKCIDTSDILPDGIIGFP